MSAVTVAEVAQAAYAAGHTAGWYDGRLDLAARQAEIRAAWQPAGRGEHERRVRERLELFEACARQLAERMGRPYRGYGGGPVDWATGRPVRELVAA